MWSRSDHSRAKPSLFQGVRGHAPPENFDNRDAQICVFSPFGSILEPEKRQQVVVLNCDEIKKSNSSLRLSWTFLRVWKPTCLLCASHWLGVAFSRRTPLRACLFFEVFPIYGGRNVNDVEEFQRRWNPFSFYPIWKLSLHSTRARPRWFENARRLIDGLVSWTRAKEWQSQWTVVRSDCTWLYLIDSFHWHGGIPSTGDTLSGALHHFMQPNFADLVASGSADRGCFPILSEVFLLRVVSTLHKSVKKEILLEWVSQEQNWIKLQEVSVHFTPTNGGAVAKRLRRRTSDQTVLGSNPAVAAAALSPWTRLFTPIVPRRSLHISFY